MDPFLLLGLEVFGFGVTVDAPILYFVWGLRKTSRATAPLFTVLNDATPDDIRLIRRWTRRQIFDPDSGIIATERRREERGLS